jgi:hypothetical protein
MHSTGAGFSGFWYHLGLLQNLPDLKDYDYYCYSSGCLSLLLAFLNTTVDSAYETGSFIQTSCQTGAMRQYEMVDYFLDDLVPAHVDDLEDILPHLNIIVTTLSHGVQIQTPSNRSELVDLLVKTTWIPFVTGRGIMTDTDGGQFLDGGFSRVLHPVCDHSMHVPLTWDTFLHTLNPGLDRKLVYKLWALGQAVQELPLASSTNALDDTDLILQEHETESTALASRLLSADFATFS